MLTLSCAIPDFALASNSQGVLQRVMGFAFVEANVCAALHVGVEQPLHGEQGALDASDFPQGKRQLMLARI